MRIAAALLLSAFAITAACAQSGWDKTYNLSAKPALQIEVDDASVKVNACGGCRAVRIHVDPRGNDLSQWRVSEMQGGNGIHFEFKHKEQHRMWGGNWHGRSPEVTIDTPSESDLSVRAGDGSLALAGIRGTIDMHTGDGSIAASDVSGALRFTTGDGSVQLHRAEGTLAATTGDGSLNLDGRFSQIEARSGNGSIRISLVPGSVLQAASRVATGDGSIHMSVPRDLKVDLEASSGDGSITCNLPMMSNSSSNNRHVVRGSVNGGGPLLHLQSGDGSIDVSGQ